MKIYIDRDIPHHGENEDLLDYLLLLSSKIDEEQLNQINLSNNNLFIGHHPTIYSNIIIKLIFSQINILNINYNYNLLTY
jgi:hypothetical protein